jgi:hypothetical protein
MNAANSGIQLLNLAGESVRRQPFDQGVRIQESPVELLRDRTDYPVKPDGIC